LIAISPWGRIPIPGFGSSNPVRRLLSRRGNGMPTKDEEAMALAQTHYQVEAGLTHVFRIIGESAVEAMPTEPIKLLEVNEYTVPSGILPIHFGPSPASGLHYPMVILEVTPGSIKRFRARN
jgi:hypothetical protein